ncbi:MAG: ABC transporter permease, partial [Calditrichaceae bacterium]
MFKNYLKTAFRNLWRNRIHSGINILGLSIGIAAVIFILLYLHHEWSYDRFHQNVDNLYRISVLENWEGRESESQHFLPTVGPALKRDFPQVNEFLRLRSPRSEYFYHRDN